MALLAWVAVASLTAGLVYKLVLHEAKAAFNQRIVQLHESIELIARDNDAVLEGFTAFLSAIEYADRGSASRYTRQILDRYAHVNTLGVALVVKQQELKAFIARQKHTWFPQFTVKPFRYRDNRSSEQAFEKKPIYYPIIFTEPMSPSTEGLIGADMDSTSFLSDALNQSVKLRSAAATIPFNLLEGARGYILFHPVPDPPSEQHFERKQALALLLVNSDTLQKKLAYLAENLEFHLYYPDYSSNKSEGSLLHIAASIPDKLEARLFPKLIAERKLISKSQPFALKVEKQLGWADFNLPLVSATACVAILLLVLLVFALNAYFHQEEKRNKSINHLLHLATHDALTGLPNRTLLSDRFSQACSRTQRRDMTFSIMFLDLNGFKNVNDTYGHEAGDQLLKAMGNILKECIREEDTVSRISGDEFVILLEDMNYENAQRVAKKIQRKLTQPIIIEGNKHFVSISLGIAVYPDEGTEMNELLRIADAKMYEAKEQSKTR
ncbi:MAG: diguanylate cyclase [Methylococcales bacterium]